MDSDSDPESGINGGDPNLNSILGLDSEDDNRRMSVILGYIKVELGDQHSQNYLSFH